MLENYNKSKSTLQPLISIIVPVYNVENYLIRCVDSLRNQSYPEIEIVLVDDGSKDNSSKMCDELAEMYPNVSAYHKINGGLSSARNFGIEHCKGDYISFVDSDDWIDTNFIARLYVLMQINEAELGCCNICVSDGSVCINTWQNKKSGIEIYDNYQLMEVLATDDISTSACNKLFSRKLLKDVRFVEGILYEDVEFMHRCLSKVKKAVFTYEPLYFYFKNDAGITRAKFSEKSFDFVSASEKRVDFYLQYYPTIKEKIIIRHLEICFNTLENSIFCNSFYSERIEIKKKIRAIIRENQQIKYPKNYLVKNKILSIGLVIFDLMVMLYKNLVLKKKHRS